MDSIEAALAEIESLKAGKKINYTKIAEKHGVSRATLSKRHRGVQGSRQSQYEKQRILNNQQSKELIKWINNLTERGLPPSQSMLRNFAKEITGNKPGKCWPNRFITRHHDELVYSYTTGIDASRKRADSAYKYALYFKLMAKKIEEYEIEPRDMYNMDEKGFLIGVLSKGKRIFSRRWYEKGGPRQRIQDGNREWITTVACICADGTALPPGLIYQAVSQDMQDTWLQDFKPDDHHCFFTASPSGWTNDELGYAWLTTLFDPETKEKARRRWRLLILDGHGSHVSMKFINFCDANKILLAIYPPHSTHSLQPLDVSLFSPLSRAYSNELEQFMHECQGLSHITKRDFFRLFWPSWNKAFSVENINSAWKSVGLNPWDPEVVLARFTRKEEERPSSSESSQSILKAEDWRRIEKLLEQVVSNVYDVKVRKLHDTIMHLSTENILVKTRCTGLENALRNEQKKRQRGKPLQLQLQAPEDGNAIFYSPKKIQQARNLQAEKEDAARLAKAAKEEDKIRRQQEKEEKQRLIEERKRIRAFNRSVRMQEAEGKRRQKEEEKAAKQAAIQLQNDIKQVNKDKKKSTGPVTAKEKEDTVKKNVEEVEEAPIAVNSRGRQIRLPQRFRDTKK